MSSTLTPDREPLVSSKKMGRDDVLELFIRVTNLTEPDHKYDVEYPIWKDEVEYSYCTRYYAKCGPRNSISKSAFFASSIDQFNSFSTEFSLAVMCHEVGHLKYGIEYGQPTHPAIFWRKMAEYAMTLIRNWSKVETWFHESPDRQKFREEVVNEPNSFTVDGRIETVTERRKKMAELMNANVSLVKGLSNDG